PSAKGDELIRGCKREAVKPPPPPKPTKVEKVKAKEPAEAPGEKTRAPDATPSTTDVTQANDYADKCQRAFVRADYNQALELCSKASKLTPHNDDAIRVLGATYCRLKNAEGATRAYLAADQKYRLAIRQLCQSEGVELNLPGD